MGFEMLHPKLCHFYIVESIHTVYSEVMPRGETTIGRTIKKKSIYNASAQV